MTRVVVIGGSDQGRQVIDALSTRADHDVVGVLDGNLDRGALVAGVAVNLRERGDGRVNNQAGMWFVPLATDEADLRERMRCIVASAGSMRDPRAAASLNQPSGWRSGLGDGQPARDRGNADIAPLCRGLSQ